MDYNSQQPPPNQTPQYPPPQYQPPPYQQPFYPAARQWPPMTLGNWIVTFLLLLIPIANIVLVFVWAFGGNTNPSKKTYFQAVLIVAAICIVLSILFAGLLATAFTSMTANAFAIPY